MTPEHLEGYRAAIAMGHARGAAGLGIGAVAPLPVAPNMPVLFYDALADIEVTASAVYTAPRRWRVTIEKRATVVADNLRKPDALALQAAMRTDAGFFLLAPWVVDPRPVPPAPPAP